MQHSIFIRPMEDMHIWASTELWFQKIESLWKKTIYNITFPSFY